MKKILKELIIITIVCNNNAMHTCNRRLIKSDRLIKCQIRTVWFKLQRIFNKILKLWFFQRSILH